MYAKLETIEVNVKTIAENAEFSLRQIVPLNVLLMKRASDGFVAVVEDTTDGRFWITVVTQNIATLEQVAKYLTFYPVD